MLTNNNLNTKAIVAKYATEVNDLAKKAGVHNEFYPISKVEMESYSSHQQLISALWYAHEGYPSEHPFCEILSPYMSFFRKSILTESEFSFLLDHYSEVIEYLFSIREEWDFITSATNDLPKEFAELASSIMVLEEGQTLFLPLCAYGDFAIKFPQCNILGFVENEEVATFTQIRLNAAGIKSNITFYPLGVSHTTVIPTDKVDAIICAAINPIIYSACQGHTLGEMYDALKPDGKMIAICTNSVFSSKKKESFRTRIYNDKSVDAVIQLPSNVMKNTGIVPTLLCIDKSPKPKEHEGIVMFDASFASSGVGISKSLKRIDVDRVLFAIKNGNLPEFENIIRNIPYDKVDASILMPKFYLLDRNITSNRHLSDLVEIVSASRKAPEGRHYSYSLSGNLATSFKDAKLSLERISESSPSVEVPGRHYVCFDADPCIFLAIVGEEVHVAYSEIMDKDAFYRVSPSVMCLKVKDSFPVDYVVALLLSKEIKEQLTALAAGMVIRHIEPQLLSKVVVPEHNKEQISLFLEGVLKASLTQRDREMQIEREEYERGVRLCKHALTQSVSSLSALFNQLNKCRVRQGGVLRNEDLVNPVLNKTVEEVFVTLASKMEVIQKKLAHIADPDFDFGEPVDIDPEDFILHYLRAKKTGWANFTGEVGWDARETTNKCKGELRDLFDNTIILNDGDTLTSFSFPKDALEHIFDNVVANAAAHGFTDESRTDYKIRFSWETQGMDVVITIENNGTSLPNVVKPEDIFKSGFSTRLNHDGHAGSGGYEIASIMRKYHGDVEIVSCPDSEFPVKYVLRFHKTNIVAVFG